MGGHAGAQNQGACWEEGCVFGLVSDPRATVTCSPWFTVLLGLQPAAGELKAPECREILKKGEEAFGPCDVGGKGSSSTNSVPAAVAMWVLWTHGFAFLSCCPLREEAVSCLLKVPA